MEFEYFFETAFNDAGFGDVGGQVQGKTYDEIMGSIDGAQHWMQTLLTAMKNWEAAMMEKKKIASSEHVMYSIVTGNTNFFLYVFSVRKGANGRPEIMEQIGRFDANEYLEKLREGVRFAEPYIKAAETIAPKLLGNG